MTDPFKALRVAAEKIDAATKELHHATAQLCGRIEELTAERDQARVELDALRIPPPPY